MNETNPEPVPGGRTQRARILEHFQSGATLTQAQALRDFGCTNLHHVVRCLRKQGHDIVDETFRSGKGGVSKVYRLAGAREDPPRPAPLAIVEEPAAQAGAPAPVDLAEVRPHHVANPDDPDQILRTFRRHCGATHGRRVEIPPGMARELLRLNWANNRDVNNAQVAAYVDAMKAGEWKYNDAQIAFDEQGRLLNGQHRLTACLLSGVPLVTDVAFDIDPESYATIDRGRGKSGADIAKNEGVEDNRTTHSAAAKILYRFDHAIEYGRKLSTRQETAALRDYPDLGPWVRTAHGMRYRKVRGIKGPRGLLAAVLYLCARVDRNAARRFAEELDAGVGEGLHPRHPAYVAQRTINDRKTFLGHSGYTEYRRILVKAWEHRRKGVDVGHFKLSSLSQDWPEGARRPEHRGDEPPLPLAAE